MQPWLAEVIIPNLGIVLYMKSNACDNSDRVVKNIVFILNYLIMKSSAGFIL